MQRKLILAIANSDLKTVAEIRYQRVAAEARQIGVRYQGAKRQHEALLQEIQRIEQEMQAIRVACLDAISGRLGSMHLYRNMLHALDVEQQRAHARADAKQDECKVLVHQWQQAKARLSALDIKRDTYAKFRRQADAIIADRVDEQDA